MSGNARNLTPRPVMTRRRFISVFAAASAVPLLRHGARAADRQTFTWEGIALGAQARLTLQHADASEAKAAMAACLAEVSRLESIFSLHQDDSALSRLNRSGRIDDAPVELRELLAEALHIAELSDGAFDPTVQPLWRLYADHFARPGTPPGGPSREAVTEAVRLVNWRAVEIDGAAISFGRPRMAITLNGIAQGYITDRAGDVLRARGFEHVLVNMGEELALGPKWDGAGWRIGIANPQAPSSVLTELSLQAGAVATSGGYGYRFDSAGRFTHILDPKTGEPARRWASVTVTANRATLADGLSTALSVASPDRARSILGGRGRAYVVPFDTANAAWL